MVQSTEYQAGQSKIRVISGAAQSGSTMHYHADELAATNYKQFFSQQKKPSHISPADSVHFNSQPTGQYQLNQTHINIQHDNQRVSLPNLINVVKVSPSIESAKSHQHHPQQQHVYQNHNSSNHTSHQNLCNTTSNSQVFIFPPALQHQIENRVAPNIQHHNNNFVMGDSDDRKYFTGSSSVLADGSKKNRPRESTQENADLTARANNSPLKRRRDLVHNA